MKEKSCPLCSGHSVSFTTDRKRSYLRCQKCLGVWVLPEFLPDSVSEKRRYEAHQNDVHDVGYRAFVSPVVDAVRDRFTPDTCGLDFGSGPHSAVSQILAEHGFRTTLYDPFFHPEEASLQELYDFVICTEVAEHFHHPSESFRLIAGLLKQGGTLFLTTHLFDDSLDFERWYYKNDFTHVFFYHIHSFSLFEEMFGLHLQVAVGRMLIFQKK